MEQGVAFFVDAHSGDDANDGSEARPWRTIQHAVDSLPPGATLYLRGGVFYEHVTVAKSGEPGKPITIRSYPGELAILDGGVREFFENPAESWEPAKDGAPHEYVSKKTFEQSGKERAVGQFVNEEDEPFKGVEDRRPLALGNFGDSMVTLHGYRFLSDLRAPDDGLWRLKANDDPDNGVYCGPGLWFNRKDGRVHIRLAPTKFDWLGEDGNYRGETDPRKIPLVIAVGHRSGVLRISNARHVRVQDVVLRGATGAALLDIENSEHVELDGVTFFGGSPSLLGKSTRSLRVVNCAFRSLGSAPWASRASMKYRGTSSYLIIARESQPLNQNWEIAQSEFTDGHDFAAFRWIRNLRFHHNFVENFNDDGLEFGPHTNEQMAWVYCNLIRKTLINLTQHEVDREAPPPFDPGRDSRIYLFRNVFDLRESTYTFPKRGEEAGSLPPGKSWDIQRASWLCGDHGSPVWSQYIFYQNTVVMAGRSWRDHYGFGLGQEGMLGNTRIGIKTLDGRAPRRVFNNIFVQVADLPGLVLPTKPEDVDLQVDGNLFWGINDGASFQGDFFAKVRQSAVIESSKKQYPPGWTANDVFGDPKLNLPRDFTIQKGSPAIDAGVPITAEWPDVLREADDGRPDIGAFPLGAKPWNVGVNGRLNVSGSRPRRRPRPRTRLIRISRTTTRTRTSTME